MSGEYWDEKQQAWVFPLLPAEPETRRPILYEGEEERLAAALPIHDGHAEGNIDAHRYCLTLAGFIIERLRVVGE